MTTDSPTRPHAIVIGGALRIGRAVVLELARRGCDVDFTYYTSADHAAHTATIARPLGTTVNTWSLDLSIPAAAASRAHHIAASSARWDIAVLCASSYEQTPLDTLDQDQLTSAFAVNAAAPALVLRQFVPKLRQSTIPGGGSITTFCDIHALGQAGTPRKGYLAYAMSKAALLQLTLTLAKELAPTVRVNAVAPGVVAWPDTGPDADPAAQAAYLKRVPLARPGTPEEAATAVRWLALEATYCTGQVIRLDGGRALT